MIFLGPIKSFDNGKKTPFNTFNLIQVPKRNYEIRTVGGESASNNHTAFARARERERRERKKTEKKNFVKQLNRPILHGSPLPSRATIEISPCLLCALTLGYTRLHGHKEK